MQPQDNMQWLGDAGMDARFLRRIEQQRLPHGMLFTGPAGVGKATFAFRLARFLLHAEPSFITPPDLAVDGESQTARLISQNAHPDFLLIAPDPEKQTISVEEARRIPQFVTLTPAMAPCRVVLIDQAEAMNANAANAVLKVLEEPPAGVYLMLVSSRAGMLLPTIRSRCVQFGFGPLEEAAFRRIVTENLESPPDGEEMRLLYTLSEGAPGFAMQLWREGAADRYAELLGVVGGSPAAVMQLAERWFPARDKSPYGFQTALFVLHTLLTRTVRSAYGPQAALFPGEQAAWSQLLGRFAPHALAAWWEWEGEALHSVERLHLDRKLVFFNALTNLLHPQPVGAR